jgi:hypothetical protein
MTDTPETLTVSDPNEVQVVFCNQVVASGYFNAVANFTLAVARFSPRPDNTVDPDLVVCARLRMDLACAQQLHEQLGKILEQNLQPKNGTSH